MSHKFVCLCATHLPASLFPFGWRTGLTARMFLLSGQRHSRRADRGNRCFSEIPEGGGWVQAPTDVWTWISGASCFYLISTPSLQWCLSGKSGWIFSSLHRLFPLPQLFPKTFSAVPLCFRGPSAFLWIESSFSLNERPNTFRFEAKSLNIEGIFQRHPSFTGKSNTREDKRGFWRSTHLPGGKKTETVRS